MCRWPLRATTPLRSISWPNINTILVTFGQIRNFRDPSLVTSYFYELTHFLDWMKNTLLFICSTNILVRLLTVNMKNCLTPKNPKMCDPIIVNPAVKTRPHPQAHLHRPLVRKYPPSPPRESSYLSCFKVLKLDYVQSRFFLGPSSKTPETRKWPRAWLKARDGTVFSFSGCRLRFSRLAASPLNALARVHSPH